MAYNLAYLKAVAMGLTKAEVVKAADKARDEASPRRAKPRWVPNPYLVVNANEKGLVLADSTLLPWVQAARVVGRLSVESRRKESLLEVMRRVYVGASGGRQHIAVMGNAIAGL